MAAAKLDTSLPTLLSNLTASLTSAAEPVPSPPADEDDTSLAPKDGISLLDVKNELLLSYLQNLVFLILLKIRNNNQADNKEENAAAGDAVDVDNVVKKLCELRLYLERGARPLEGKLKYQIDKVVRAADDAARAEEALKKAGSGPSGKKTKKKAEDDASGSEEEEEEDDDDDDEDEEASDIDELAYRPNPLAFSRDANTKYAVPGSEADKNKSRKRGDAPSDGIYRPPRITATSMPDLPRHGGERESRDARDRGPRRAAAIDDFVDELSTAPAAMPSIGSNVVAGGRRIKSARERKEEEERQAYEETNFVRLAKPGKKEKAKQASRDRGAFGGEEWRELGAGVDRIDRLTRRGERTSTKGALELSRKRAVEDGPRASGAQEGAMFAKRRKVAGRKR